MSRFEALMNEGKQSAPADCFLPYPKEHLRGKLHEGSKYIILKNSIEANGYYDPVSVMLPPEELRNNREYRGKFIVIDGHNRVKAGLELGKEVPYRLFEDISEDAADLMCMEKRILNRQIDEMLPSELATILKERHDLLVKMGVIQQGKRNDLAEELTSGHGVAMLDEEFKLSARSIQRYIKLNDLDKALLDMVDEKTITIRAGVTLSYLKLDEQVELGMFLTTYKDKLFGKENGKTKFTEEVAKELKKLSQENEAAIDINSILLHMVEPKSKKKNTEVASFKFKPKTLKSLSYKIETIVPAEQWGNIEDIIEKALLEYVKTH